MALAFIGEILDVKADADVPDDKNRPDMEKIGPFVFAPAQRSYYRVQGFLGNAFSLGKEYE